MPDVEIFIGSRTTRTKSASITIDGHDDRANITFGVDDNSYSAQISNFTLSDLKRTILFKKASKNQKPTTEKLLNTWHTLETENSIIKYSTKDQVAFVFTAQNDVKKLFDFLCEIDISIIAYINELNFSRRLAGINLTIDNLRKASEQHLQIFFAESQAFFALLYSRVPATHFSDIRRFKLYALHFQSIPEFTTLGVNYNELAKVKLEVLEKYFELNYPRNLFKFVTVRQMLGVDHVPPGIPQDDEQELFKIDVGGGSIGDHFSYQRSDEASTITHTDPVSNHKTALIISLKSNCTDISEEMLNSSTEVELIHNWRKLEAEEDGALMIAHYSPELNCSVAEIIGSGFPVDKFTFERKFLPTYGMAYYQEESFCAFLNGNGFSAGDYKKIGGMTIEKMVYLAQHLGTVKEIIGKGFKLEDFAEVEIKRLKFVVGNFSQAEFALKVVGIRELFGIGGKAEVRVANSGLFGFFGRKQQAALVTDEKENTSRCVIS